MWKKFWFESNRFFDHVSSPEDWIRLRAAYPSMTDSELLDSREATYNDSLTLERRDSRPNYGMRLEHDGERTLRQFFEANEMMRLLPAISE